MSLEREARLDRTTALAAQVVAFLYSCLSLLRPSRMLVATMPDDAAYFLTIARNFAAGYGWTFDRIHPTNGFQPAWEYLLVLLCRLLPGSAEMQMRWIAIFETLLLSITLFLLWRLVDRHFGTRAGAFAAVLFVAIFYFPTRSGMETTLSLFLAVLVLRMASGGHPWAKGAAGAARTGLLLGILMLTRLDVVFYSGLFVLALVAGGRVSGLSRSRVVGGFVITVTIAAAIVLPYLLYNLATTHHVMPISGAVKSAFPSPGWHWSAFGMAAQDRAIFLLATLLAAGTLAWWFGSGRRVHDMPLWRYGVVPLCAGTLIQHFYSILFMRWGVRTWHFALDRVLVTVLLAAVIGPPFVRMPRTAARSAWVLLCLGLFLVGAAAVYRRDWGSVARDSWRARSYDTALWVRTHLPEDAVLAMTDCGYLGLLSDRRVVNLDGIVNNFDYQESLRRGEFKSYLHASGVGYLVMLSAPTKPYGVQEFDSFSHLYDLPGGSIHLKESLEVYRSRPYGDPRAPSQITIWRLEG